MQAGVPMPPESRLVPLRPLPPEGDAAIRLECVRATRDGREVLRGVDLSLGRHGITALVGPPGAETGLILRLIAGLPAPGCAPFRPPDDGRLHLADGLSPPAIVLRDASVLRRTTRGNILHALGLAGVTRRERARQLATLLTETSLTQQAGLPARNLTRGEGQRLQIARALACAPDCLLLEDPATGLAPAAAAVVESLIRHVSDRGIKVVIATSDLALAARLAHDVAFIHRGRVTEHRPAREFFTRPVSDEAAAYVAGRLLL